MRALWGVFATLTALLAVASATCTPAFAKLPKGIELKVEVGYENVVHPGKLNPVAIDLANNSADLNIAGEIAIEYNGTEYISRLDLPTPSRKRLYLYFPCDAYSPVLKLRIRSKAYTDEFVLGEPGSFKSATPEDISVMVLTRRSGSLGILNQQTAARLYRDLYRSGTTSLGAGRMFVSYYNLDEVDQNPKFFQGSDIVILSDIDYQQATSDLAEALRATASGGTSVVFSLGLNGAGVAASPLGTVCPLQASSTRQVMSLGSFGQRYGIRTGSAPATLATGTLAHGAAVLEWAGDVPVIVQQQVGSGTVTALAFDYAQVPFKQNARIAEVFQETVLPIDENISVTNWFIHPQQVALVLAELTEGAPLKPYFVLLFLGIYVLLIGPMNFLILDRLKRRTLVWTTIPLIILAFTYLGLINGYIYRGTNNVVSYFQEQHVYPEAVYVPYQTIMLVFTAERTNYKLKVPDRSAFLRTQLPEIADPYGMPAASIAAGGGGGRVDDSEEPEVSASQGKWTQRTYGYTGYLPFTGAVHSELEGIRQEGNLELSGTFELDLPYDLFGCFLKEPGQEKMGRDLINVKGKGIYAIEDLYSAKQDTLPDPKTNYLIEQIGSLESLQVQSSDFGLQYKNEVLLVGFTEDVGAKALFPRQHADNSLSMVVIHLPFKPRLDTPDSAFISRTLLLGGSGFALQSTYMGEVGPRRYLLQPDGTLTFGVDVGGDIQRDTRMFFRLEGYNPNEESEEFSDLTPYVELDIKTAGGWRRVRFLPNDPPYVSVAEAIDDDRRVTFRVKSIKEVALQLGDIELN